MTILRYADGKTPKIGDEVIFGDPNSTISQGLTATVYQIVPGYVRVKWNKKNLLYDNERDSGYYSGSFRLNTHPQHLNWEKIMKGE